jgi:hypothetical protein
MGGIIGDIAINSKGEIFAGVYSVWITYSGLYKSIDNGDSWEKIADFQVYAIYINKQDHIFVSSNLPGVIHRSTDFREDIGRQPAGVYEFSINANDISSGIYFYKLEANEYIEIKKIILLK